MLYKILATIASVITVGFGLWHFFVPKLWQWYSRIDAHASELVLAVMMTNLFFSLSLVLMGLTNLVLVWSSQTSEFALLVVLSAAAVLWITRAAVQIHRPQGSINRRLQFGMLAAFTAVALLYVTSIVLIVSKE
jgi:hypothetical protein